MTTSPASPWAGLLAPKRAPAACAQFDTTTKVGRLLAELAASGPLATNELSRRCGMTTHQVWGLLKGPHAEGRVRFDDGKWSMDDAHETRKLERAAALLRSHGWRVERPVELPVSVKEQA